MTRSKLSPFALFLALTWPGLSLLLGGHEPDRFLEQSLLLFVLGCGVLALPFSQRTLWCLVLLLLPATMLWGVFAHEFGGSPNTGTLIALAHSNPAEATEWLHSHPGPAVWAILLAAGSATMLVRAPRQPVFNPAQRRTVFAGFLLFVLTAIIQHDYWYGKRTSWALVTANDIETIWPASPLWFVIDTAWGNINDPMLSAPQFVNLQRQPPLPVQGVNDEPLLVILVIGESHRRDTLNPSRHPALARRLAAKKLVWFSDVCAGATLTFYSVPALVTGASAEQGIDKGQNAPSGLTYFKQAGFSTAWISNQDDGIFREAGWDYSAFSRRTSSNKPDETLLPGLRKFLQSAPKKAAVVLHVQGSHFDYENRYPADAALKPTSQLTGLELERAHYYNSEAYAASVLDRILGILDQESRPAILLFTSDHGENLKDDERNLWRHGASRTVSAAEIKVPAFVAWNTRYAMTRQESLTNIESNAHKPLAHANLFPLWLRLGGLTSAAAPAHASPDAVEFAPDLARTFRNSASSKVESCETLY